MVSTAALKAHSRTGILTGISSLPLSHSNMNESKSTLGAEANDVFDSMRNLWKHKIH